MIINERSQTLITSHTSGYRKRPQPLASDNFKLFLWPKVLGEYLFLGGRDEAPVFIKLKKKNINADFKQIRLNFFSPKAWVKNEKKEIPEKLGCTVQLVPYNRLFPKNSQSPVPYRRPFPVPYNEPL